MLIYQKSLVERIDLEIPSDEKSFLKNLKNLLTEVERYDILSKLSQEIRQLKSFEETRLALRSRDNGSLITKQ